MLVASTLPEHSVLARPPMSSIAAAMSSWVMLSSMMMSAPASTASRTISRFSHSTSTVAVKDACARAISIARATPPAASMWLSLSMTAVERL